LIELQNEHLNQLLLLSIMATGNCQWENKCICLELNKLQLSSLLNKLLIEVAWNKPYMDNWDLKESQYLN